MDNQNRQLRDITADVRALAGELRNGTIERVLGMSDIELGLRYLLGKQSWAGSTVGDAEGGRRSSAV